MVLDLTDCDWAVGARWLHAGFEAGVEHVVALLGPAGFVWEAVPVFNSHHHPARNFRIYKHQLSVPRSLLRGFIHSHPIGQPNPSRHDLRCCPKGLIGGIYHDGEITAWFDHTGNIKNGRRPSFCPS